MPLPRLPLLPNQPEKTQALKRFEGMLTELNSYYWTSKCSLVHTTRSLAGVEKVSDLVPPEIASHLSITSAEFITKAPVTERWARNTFLVISVTVFEDYLKEVLSTFLVINWAVDKKYRISFRPSELPDPAKMSNYLRDLVIASQVDEIVNKPYDHRFNAIINLLIEYGAPKPNLHQEMAILALVACEARNCIVHSSGIIDSRTADGLSRIFTGITIGSTLNITEDQLWRLLGALRDTASAIDLAIRSTI